MSCENKNEPGVEPVVGLPAPAVVASNTVDPLASTKLQLEKLQLDVEQLRNQRSWRTWWSQSKPTEWATALAVILGVSAAWRSGLFDAKSERLSTQKLLVDYYEREVIAKRAELASLVSEDSSLRALEGIRDNKLFIRLSHDFRRGRAITLSDAGHWAQIPGYGEPEDSTQIGEVLKAIQGIRNLSEIEVINLRLDSTALAVIAANGQLNAIKLSNCGLSEDTFAGLSSTLSAQRCDYSLNKITAFSSCPINRRATWLSLRGNPFASSGLPSLTKTFPNIEWLDLSYTNVGDDELEKIAALPKLQLLILEKSKVSQVGLKKLIGAPALSAVYADDELVTDGFRAEWLRLESKAALLRHREPPPVTHVWSQK